MSSGPWGLGIWEGLSASSRPPLRDGFGPRFHFSRPPQWTSVLDQFHSPMELHSLMVGVPPLDSLLVFKAQTSCTLEQSEWARSGFLVSDCVRLCEWASGVLPDVI